MLDTLMVALGALLLVGAVALMTLPADAVGRWSWWLLPFAGFSFVTAAVCGTWMAAWLILGLAHPLTLVALVVMPGTMALQVWCAARAFASRLRPASPRQPPGETYA